MAQYAVAEIHDNPPIYEYWSNTHLRPRLNSVLGVDTISDFYVNHIRERAASVAHSEVRILSLGAGDAELEVQIARELLAAGLRSFTLECLELSPVLIGRAIQRIAEAGLGSYVNVFQSDLNSWFSRSLSNPYTAVLANHVLHHLVELEELFSSVGRAIGDNGVFLTIDMIGRNGHMRWPEALSLVNALWETLPDALKYNHVFRKTELAFENWDCRLPTGFEGIRAQDILPLLVERFHFEKFLAYGNLPEVFCDRAFGPTFDPSLPAHTHFIDLVEQLNSTLLELGVLKPTMMFAVLSNRDSSSTRFWKNLSPRFCLRDPGSLDLSSSRQKSESLAEVRKPETFSFREGDGGARFLRSGWSFQEHWATWMVGQEAILELPVPAVSPERSTFTLTLDIAAFIPRRLYSRSFTFLVGGVAVGRVTFFQSEKGSRKYTFEMSPPEDATFLLRIVAHEETSPSEDGSADRRQLGLALLDIAID